MKRRDFSKWDDSLEGVLYNLRIWGEATTADERDKILISETLLKLPKKVRQKVLAEVVFILLRADAITDTLFFTKRINKKRLKKVNNDYIIEVTQSVIMINFSHIGKRSKKYKMSVIAHEIAHFILQHDLPDNHSKNKEKEADDLSEKWGFVRAYKSYK